ncbi:MAG: energy coupling factor transporter S component ThiW [Candidatus Bathyarchaeota archaeon]|nr:energy coupling factor transporter S component ThiW [Candidatus Bathyarchaeota archaeon]
MKTSIIHVKKLALVIVFSALGIAISPFTVFLVFGTKANPTQHMVNAILGVFVGPFWAALAAIFIGTIRNMLGTGTVYAFPGGIPGAIVVGVVYWILKRLKRSEKTRLASALAEPIGTVLIGASIALFLLAPWTVSLNYSQSLLDLTAQQGRMLAFLIFGAGWALSCVPGSIIGFVILLILHRVGINRETLFGEK